MALVAITLTEEDQDCILAREQNYSRNFAGFGNPWTFLADKIRRAQKVDRWEDEKWTAGPDEGTPYWSGDPVKFLGPQGP